MNYVKTSEEIISLLSGASVEKNEKAKEALKKLVKARDKFPHIDWSGLFNNAYYMLGDHNEAINYGIKALITRNSYYIKNEKEIKSTLRNSNKPHAIAYSLFGNDPIYLFPLLKNILTFKNLIQPWNIVVHSPSGGVNHEFIVILEELGARVIWHQVKWPNHLLCGLRFHSLSDDSYASVHLRDADSLIMSREFKIIDNWWSAKNKNSYVIRDHIQHVDLILAGLFGSNLIFDINWNKEIEQEKSIRGADQRVLNRNLWRHVYFNGIQYDRFYMNKIKGSNYASINLPNPLNEDYHMGAKMPLPNKKFIDEIHPYLRSSSISILEKYLYGK